MPVAACGLAVCDDGGEAAEIGWSDFGTRLPNPMSWRLSWLSLRMSFYAMLTNVVFGTLVAWVLVRYEFPGKGLANALVDLPFALPTAVTGIALATLYAPNGWIGRFFEPLGIKIAFTPVGIWIALLSSASPFIVRAVQLALEELSGEYEEAAATLSANRFTTFRRVLLSEITLKTLDWRGNDVLATGEYGSAFLSRAIFRWFLNPAADYYGQAGTVRRTGRVGGGVVYAAGFVCDSVCAECDAVGVGQGVRARRLRSFEIPVTVIPAQAESIGEFRLIYFLFSCCPVVDSRLRGMTAARRFFIPLNQ